MVLQMPYRAASERRKLSTMRSPLPFPCVPDRPYKILLTCRWGPCPAPTPRLVCPFYLFIYLYTKKNNLQQSPLARHWARDWRALPLAHTFSH